jgi:hypothetical protein
MKMYLFLVFAAFVTWVGVAGPALADVARYVP